MRVRVQVACKGAYARARAVCECVCVRARACLCVREAVMLPLASRLPVLRRLMHTYIHICTFVHVCMYEHTCTYTFCDPAGFRSSPGLLLRCCPPRPLWGWRFGSSALPSQPAPCVPVLTPTAWFGCRPPARGAWYSRALSVCMYACMYVCMYI